MIAPNRRVMGKWDVARRTHFSPCDRLTPPQLFVGSFALLVSLGTLGLKFLPGLYTGAPLGWLDAVFTSTSAVCVTGLAVVDTATYFTFAGQAFLLLLIQLGGLGMLAFTTLIIVALGRRISLRQHALSAESFDAAPHVDPRRLALDIVRFTFIFEGIGSVLLYFLWAPDLGWKEALWPAVFHSISAFCNAGFSTFSDSLVGFQRSPMSLIVVMALVISGGLGFLTLEELYLRYFRGQSKRMFRISLHSRIVIVMSAALIVFGAVLFSVFEWDATLAELTPTEKVVNASFLSVTSRTAGFNTIDYSRATDGSNLLTILFMMVGGSPGSTAGGIKTTTIALMMLVAWSRLRGYETTSFWSRSVREETTDRALGLFVIGSVVAIAGIFVLTTSEQLAGKDGEFLHRAFEAVSAFNTVGLSMGITGQLSAVGRWTAIALMFLGRVGPLTLAAALAVSSSGRGAFRYAYEDVVVG